MPIICPPLDVSSLPYARRQLVIVLPDQVVAVAREAEANAAAQAGAVDWAEVAGRIAKTLLRLTTIYGVAYELAAEAVKAWAKARENGLNVLQIGNSEASSLQFPPGHPREQTMYVAHPATPTVYYTAATFHRMVFEHKFSEAIRLLMSLGASHIMVEHIYGWSSDFSSKIAAGISSKDGKLTAEIKESASSKLLFEARLKNDGGAELPSDLVWYPHEQTWKAIAIGRLKHGMQEFSLNVVYEDDFGINAGLKLKVQKAGFELGGSFEDHKATTWKIHGTFTSNAT